MKKINVNVESVDVVANNNSAWAIGLQGIGNKRESKEQKAIDKNILLVSRTPKQTIAAMNNMIDEQLPDGMTLRTRLEEAGIKVGAKGLTLKSLYRDWAWKDEQGQLLHLATRTAKLCHEDEQDEVVYAFDSKKKKWVNFKKLEVARLGVEVDFMGHQMWAGWSIAAILESLRQMQYLSEYQTKQMEYEQAWTKAKSVAVFAKVQNKGGMTNKPKFINKEAVQFV